MALTWTFFVEIEIEKEGERERDTWGFGFWIKYTGAEEIQGRNLFLSLPPSLSLSLCVFADTYSVLYLYAMSNACSSGLDRVSQNIFCTEEKS